MATASTAGMIQALLALVAFSAVAVAEAAKVPAMYVFGDSTADVGSNNYLPGSAVPRANFPHNGVDFPTSRATGRFSNGYNGVDFLGTFAVLRLYFVLLCCISPSLLASAYTSLD
jgi:hypothetical protein